MDCAPKTCHAISNLFKVSSQWPQSKMNVATSFQNMAIDGHSHGHSHQDPDLEQQKFVAMPKATVLDAMDAG